MRHPVPSGAVQREIVVQIDEIYKLSQQRTIEQQLQTAKELLAMGKQSHDNMDERFVESLQSLPSGYGAAKRMTETLRDDWNRWNENQGRPLQSLNSRRNE